MALKTIIDRRKLARHIANTDMGNYDVFKAMTDLAYRLDAELDGNGSFVTECGLEYDPNRVA